jgi:hypothetical protein
MRRSKGPGDAQTGFCDSIARYRDPELSSVGRLHGGLLSLAARPSGRDGTLGLGLVARARSAMTRLVHRGVLTPQNHALRPGQVHGQPHVHTVTANAVGRGRPDDDAAAGVVQFESAQCGDQVA